MKKFSNYSKYNKQFNPNISNKLVCNDKYTFSPTINNNELIKMNNINIEVLNNIERVKKNLENELDGQQKKLFGSNVNKIYNKEKKNITNFNDDKNNIKKHEDENRKNINNFQNSGNLKDIPLTHFFK